MRSKNLRTLSAVARQIKAGAGQGEGESYKPWITVRNVPSLGRSRIVKGLTCGRTHHLLSDLEYYFWLVCDFEKTVVDIREQFPLLPLADTQRYADELGFKHPVVVGTKTPFVMTTDFVLTIQSGGPNTHLLARAVKYSKEIEENKRAREKLAIEKCYWNSRGVDWRIVTELSMSKEYVSNLDYIYGRAKNSPSLTILPLDELQAFLTSIQADKHSLTLKDRILLAALHLDWSTENATAIFNRCIWDHLIITDLHSKHFTLCEARAITVDSTIFEKVNTGEKSGTY